jgi:CheY-like chemotaxis protein
MKHGDLWCEIPTMGDWHFAKPWRRGVMNRLPRGKLVLVVEDHEDTQACIAEQLADYGFEVVTASDGESAMRLMRERRPALVYLDMNLPNVSGYDVCEQIRTDPSLRDIPVVMTSAFTSITVHAACIEAGADAFVPKPFQLDVFAEMIGRMVSRTPEPSGPDSPIPDSPR